ncbi:hypothetical protein HMPREF3127_02315 [Sphingobacterium sp. HMSC13C05]|uniref:DUF3800 domain-containing protein n=1 Tax=Sphingobacterium sp. HMSC13C05 TaxID=1581095 RepID=UPI0008A122D1|nr:DUF3800 domain-containing protein [Sphingobacterium sp. HMSC13C05]OFV20937.1 hypothetical protein HMPREF3127_02315 [Sphingobacterium sp. HMSC13C05]
MIKKIYIDESGYTGHNYLDVDQPIFAVSSTDINPQDAEAILKKSFPNYKGREFKLGNIWNSVNHQGLTLFSKLFEEHSSCTFTYYVDKNYLVLIHMVEWLIEPHQTRAGIDFYADGYCRKLTNYLHYLLTVVESNKLLPEMVKEYQLFSRKPNLLALDKLKIKLEKFSEIIQHPIAKLIIRDMAIMCEHLPKITDIEEFKSTNELHLTTFLSSICWWRQNFKEDFHVIHDVSSNFKRQIDIWYNVTNSQVPPYLHPLGDGSFVQYPLRVLETISQNSEDNYSIQFCDIVAGLCTKYLDNRVIGNQRIFLQKIMAGGLLKMKVNGLRPERIFPEGPPKKRTGPDAVDLMSKNIGRQ